MLKRTPLYAAHVAAHARMVPFAGWEMPVQYLGVVVEHQAVRTRVGIFDVSHMGILDFSGEEVPEFLDFLLTNRVQDLARGQVRYSLMCREDGGILDDVLVYRLPDDGYRLVVNAANTDKIVLWLTSHITHHKRSIQVSLRNSDLTLLAVQGPRAISLIQGLVRGDTLLEHVGYYRGTMVRFLSEEMVATRTGYTGEDGFELFVPVGKAEQAWHTLLETGAPYGIQPAGLGARDTLRLEAALPLYGHELDESTNPLEAKLGRFVHFEKADFIGKRALLKVQEQGPARELIGLEMSEAGIARQGYPVQKEGHDIGVVTSGTFGPTVQKAIGMAYVRRDTVQVDDVIQVQIRGQPRQARVVPLPFYRRPKPAS